MIQANDFIIPAREFGFETWAGVPGSSLAPFINSLNNEPGVTYIASANEGDAVATATGVALAGRRAVAIMENSGLGNAVSPLSSLNWVFRLPVLLIITLRGEPGLPDESQHELMGQITTRILDELQIPWVWFPRRADEVEGVLTVANWQMDRTGLPYALVMHEDSMEGVEANNHWLPAARPAGFSSDDFSNGEASLSRQQALTTVVEQTNVDQTIVIGTTGYTSRELFSIADRPNHLYMVGSMGCASSLGLGLSKAAPEHQVVVADGDGAALMRMGNLSTIGAYAASNFRHLVLDNGMYESTGGQSTVSPAVSFAAIAKACGYHDAVESLSLDSLVSFLEADPGPSLLQLKICPGVPSGLPRPNVNPREVKQRLMKHLEVDAPWTSL